MLLAGSDTSCEAGISLKFFRGRVCFTVVAHRQCKYGGGDEYYVHTRETGKYQQEDENVESTCETVANTEESLETRFELPRETQLWHLATLLIHTRVVETDFSHLSERKMANSNFSH